MALDVLETDVHATAARFHASYGKRLAVTVTLVVVIGVALWAILPRISLLTVPLWWWRALLATGWVAWVVRHRLPAWCGARDEDHNSSAQRPWLPPTAGHVKYQSKIYAAFRWLLLVDAAAVAGFFGLKARWSNGTFDILDIELSSSHQLLQSLTCGAVGCNAQIRAALAYDLGFIGAYVLLLTLVTTWSGSYFRLGRVRGLRQKVAAAALVAGLLDLVENAMIWLGTGAVAGDLVWRIAAVAAWFKLALLVITLAYCAGGVFAWWSTPRWVREASWRLAVPPDPEGEPLPRHLAPSLGIALSGGGIRASSISLGALQVLEGGGGGPPGVLGWDAARAVTAISGGSNMAAGWSITRSSYTMLGGGRHQPPGDDPRPWAGGPDLAASPEEEHLRSNLGYLASSHPRGNEGDLAAAGLSSSAASQQRSGTAQEKLDQERREQLATLRPTAYATVFTGLLINTTVFLSVLWILARCTGWVLRDLSLRQRAQGRGVTEEALWSTIMARHLYLPGIVGVGVGVILVVVWVVAAQKALKKLDRHAVWRWLLALARNGGYATGGLGVVLFAVLFAFPAVVAAVAQHPGGGVWTALGGAATVLGSVGRVLAKPAARFAPAIGGLVFVLGMTFVAALWASSAAISHTDPSWRLDTNSRLTVVLALVVLAGFQLGVSPERWSLSPFYRGKLRLAYATRRIGARAVPFDNDNSGTIRGGSREPNFAAFTDGTPTTPLVVCATCSISSRAVRTQYGTPALSVTFDPDHMVVRLPDPTRQGTRQYAVATELLGELGRPMGKRITTMLAVAISSAALSPAMGRFRVGPTSMLLAFANIRLGAWVANPRYVQALGDAEEGLNKLASVVRAKVESHNGAERKDGRRLAPSYPRTGLGYLFKEFFGIHDLDDPYLYLTDGGHWENTGLVELLRRGDVAEIVCIDADMGPGDAASSVSKAINIAPQECGVHVRLDTDPLRTVIRRTNAPDYSPRNVTIGFFSQSQLWRPESELGVIWYAKPGLVSDMPSELLAFREDHPDFPRITTTDQFFDVGTFVAYRDLGRYNATEILLARLALRATLSTLLTSGVDTVAQLAVVAADPESHWVVAELSAARLALRVADEQLTPFLRAVQEAVPERATITA